jgi:hypothetical protein
MSDVIKNKVAESGIITLDLEKYFPTTEIVEFDIKDYLFMGMILKEKDFRQSLKELDLEKYKEKLVAVTCSADAVIPMWAYMLIASTLQPISKEVSMGNKEDLKTKEIINNLKKINTEEYLDKRIVVKGCGEHPIPEGAYLEITKLLRPVAKSIMFGEPCSTVPIFKK